MNSVITFPKSLTCVFVSFKTFVPLLEIISTISFEQYPSMTVIELVCPDEAPTSSHVNKTLAPSVVFIFSLYLDMYFFLILINYHTAFALVFHSVKIHYDSLPI